MHSHISMYFRHKHFAFITNGNHFVDQREAAYVLDWRTHAIATCVCMFYADAQHTSLQREVVRHSSEEVHEAPPRHPGVARLAFAAIRWPVASGAAGGAPRLAWWSSPLRSASGPLLGRGGAGACTCSGGHSSPRCWNDYATLPRLCSFFVFCQTDSTHERRTEAAFSYHRCWRRYTGAQNKRPARRLRPGAPPPQPRSRLGHRPDAEAPGLGGTVSEM